MKQRKWYSKTLCFLLAFALILPGSFAGSNAQKTKAAETQNESVDESVHGTAEDIINLEKKLPDEYAEYKKIDVYNNKSNPFLLSEQNELFLFRTTGTGASNIQSNGWYYENCDMTLRSSVPKDDIYLVDSINNYNSNKKKSNGSITEHKLTFSNDLLKNVRYVQGTGFDPLGSGRKEYAGYVGWYADNLYCFVINPNNGSSWSVKLNSMNWVSVCEPDYYEMINFMSITAGDYDGDHKDSLIVYGCGDGSDLNIYEVKFNGKALTAQKILNLASTKTSTNEPILYKDNYKYVYGMKNNNFKNLYSKKDEKKYILRNRVQVTLTTGDFDGDEQDEYAFTAGYSNTSTDAKNGFNGKANNVEGFSTTVGIVDYKNNWTAPTAFYMYDMTGTPAVKGKEQTWNLQIMNGGSLTASDTDGDGIDEIVVAGYTSYNKHAKGVFDVTNVTVDNKTVEKYNCKSLEHIYDLDEDFLVTSVISATIDTKKNVTYSRSKLETLKYEAFQKKCIGNKQNEAYVFPHISMASAKTNGVGHPEDVFIAGTIYSFEGGSAQKQFSPKIMTQTFESVMNYSKSTAKSYVFWVNNVAVGNFDHNDNGREQFVYTVWFKKSGEDTDYAYLGIVGGSKYDDTYDGKGKISSYGTCQQYAYSDVRGHNTEVLWSKTGNASGVLSSAKGLYSNAVPVAIDNNKDGLKAKYHGAYYAYSDPEVVAVLEAAPYFKECQEPGSISYTVTNGYGRSKSNGWDVSFNVGFTGEFGATTGFKINAEAGVTNGFSKTFTESYTVSESTTITATDQTSVIVSRIPVMVYVYDIEKSDGSWATAAHTVTVPLTPVMFSMNIEEYNDFVDKYNNYLNEKENQIKNKKTALTDKEKQFLSMNKPLLVKLKDDGNDLPANHEGDPFAYIKPFFNKKGTLVSQPNTVSKNNGSTGAEWTYEKSTDEEYTHSHGFYVSMSFQWGFQLAIDSWAGFNVGLEANWSFTNVKSNFTGKAVSAEIPNFSTKDMKAKGFANDQINAYGYSWTLGTWERKLNGSSNPAVPIYGFTTTGVTAPVAPVDDLEAEMSNDSDGNRFVKLTWTNPGTSARPVDGFIIYRVTEETTKSKKTKTVKTEVARITQDEYDFKCEKNVPTYSFVVVAYHTYKNEKNKDVTQTSPESNMVTASYQDKMIYDIMKKSEITDKDKIDAKTGDKNAVSSGSGDEDALVIFYNDGSTKEIAGATGKNGEDGKSAYDIAVENGFKGDVNAWLESLKGAKGEAGSNGTGIQGNPGKDGADGKDGDSAYEIAVKNGFEGSEAEWLESLKGQDGTVAAKGEDGKSAYELAMDGKTEGDEGYMSQADWLASLKGADGTNGTNGTDGTNGKSAYEIAKEKDPTIGTEVEWLESLKGTDGANGKSAYEIAMTGKQPGDNGYYSTEAAWIASLGTNGITISSIQIGSVYGETYIQMNFSNGSALYLFNQTVIYKDENGTFYNDSDHLVDGQGIGGGYN